MYLEWLYDQIDAGGSIGDFAKLVQDDQNNGCLPPVKRLQTLDKHFQEKHVKSYDTIRAGLEESFVAWTKTLPNG